MEPSSAETLRAELRKLLKKQNEVLVSRTFGVANEIEILEYEIREDIIHEICIQLAESAAAQRDHQSPLAWPSLFSRPQ